MNNLFEISKDVQKAIDLRPKNPYSDYKLGLVYQQQSRFSIEVTA